ncbi:MAG TPA: sensor histidine kinase [Chitinophagaceae bacterium]|jgi:signal transduction histidine kinase|nr:sensor histidine kinase [Chitinophagaceae bacterium]
MDAQEARIYMAVIITVVVLGIIIGYFAISVIRQQRRNMELQKANALAEISAMERERARIAIDLHDDVGPVLSVIKFRVDNANVSDAEEQEELKKASAQLDEVIARMREVSNNLMPSVLQRKGLVAAIEDFITNAEGSSGIHMRFDYFELPPFTEEQSIHLYRIVQECIHNCMKHAKATQLDISFTFRNGILSIQYRDNGRGFHVPEQRGKYPGIGMRSLSNRTTMMGGTMDVESEPDKGTVLFFEIPIR